MPIYWTRYGPQRVDLAGADFLCATLGQVWQMTNRAWLWPGFWKASAKGLGYWPPVSEVGARRLSGGLFIVPADSGHDTSLSWRRRIFLAQEFFWKFPDVPPTSWRPISVKALMKPARDGPPGALLPFSPLAHLKSAIRNPAKRGGPAAGHPVSFVRHSVHLRRVWRDIPP